MTPGWSELLSLCPTPRLHSPLPPLPRLWQHRGVSRPFPALSSQKQTKKSRTAHSDVAATDSGPSAKAIPSASEAPSSAEDDATDCVPPPVPIPGPPSQSRLANTSASESTSVVDSAPVATAAAAASSVAAAGKLCARLPPRRPNLLFPHAHASVFVIAEYVYKFYIGQVSTRILCIGSHWHYRL